MPDGRGSEESTIFVAGLPSDMTNLEMPLDVQWEKSSMGSSLYPNVPLRKMFLIYGNDFMLYDYGNIYICVCRYGSQEICEIYENLRCLHFGYMIMVEIMVID